MIEDVRPRVDGGRFPVKRIVGDRVTVEADVFADGHDVVRGVLRYRHANDADWSEVDLAPTAAGNDRWEAAFAVDRIGGYRYTVRAWVDRFGTWSRDLQRRLEAGQDPAADLAEGAEIVSAAARNAAAASAEAGQRLAAWSEVLRWGGAEAVALAGGAELAALVAVHGDRGPVVELEREIPVEAERERARYGAWYEIFPRSCAPEPGRHGTFLDLERWLPYIAGMGFDVLYLPPIHPVGRTGRKGRNNTSGAGPDDPGSPWAIGAAEGGHSAIHPDLGDREDFLHLMAAAREHGLEMALDLALQCSPDHPYVRGHPEWFQRRPDGSIRYAENPPKRYEDIYPLDFACAAWRPLWEEIRAVVLQWVGLGVRIFRVDNPHTKPFAFWEWLLAEVRAACPEVVFLAEAFTRPKVMRRLAKLGFSQSYTYFAWRSTRHELEDYLTELTRGESADYLRPNLWPNTPDILTAELQTGGRPAFALRFVLAATLGASYGIYGPAFERCEALALEPGREEYLDSEKYEIRHREPVADGGLQPLIARVNRIRREHPALQRNDSLRFHPVDNERLIAYTKRTPDLEDTVLTVVNLDAHHVQSGWVELPLGDLGLRRDEVYQVHDMLTDARYLWQGPRGYVILDPATQPAHVFALRRHVVREGDFDYFA